MLLRRRSETAAEPERDPVVAADTPSLDGVGPWVNTRSGVKLDGLLGTVVLLDFWTYVCGNCTRMVPMLNELDETFAREELTIVGVHTPELAVDRNRANVAAAVSELGIRYPVGMDNDFVAWRRWDVHAWPTLFLLDRDGRLRRRHVGEGGQRSLKRAVGRLVAER